MCVVTLSEMLLFAMLLYLMNFFVAVCTSTIVSFACYLVRLYNVVMLVK